LGHNHRSPPITSAVKKRKINETSKEEHTQTNAIDFKSEVSCGTGLGIGAAETAERARTTEKRALK